MEIPTGPTIVYRRGGGGATNFTPRLPKTPGGEWDSTGLSTWNKLGAIAENGKPAFQAGDKVQAIDLSTLINLRGVAGARVDPTDRHVATGRLGRVLWLAIAAPVGPGAQGEPGWVHTLQMSHREAWEMIGRRFDEVFDRVGAALRASNAALSWQSDHLSSASDDRRFVGTLEVFRHGDPRDGADLVVSVEAYPYEDHCLVCVDYTEGPSFVIADGPALEFEVDEAGVWQERMLGYLVEVERFLNDQMDTMRDIVT